MANIKEVIELCLEEESDENILEFVGIQDVANLNIRSATPH